MELFTIGTPLSTLKTSDKSYRWLVDNSTKINLSSKSTVDKFYKIYMTDDTKMYRYIINPEFGQVSSNFRMRYLLISVDNDFVFVPLKIIDLMGRGESYITISMEPISQNSNKQSIIKVLEVLKEFPCIRFVVRNETEEKDALDNNYYNVRDAYDHMNKSKWRSKRGVNILDSLIDFKYEAEKDSSVIEDVYKVNQIWDEIKIANKMNNFSFPNKNMDKKLATLACGGGATHIYTFSYKGKMIGYSIPIMVSDKYVVLMSTKQITADYKVLADYIGEDTEELYKIYRHMSSYMQFKIHQDVFERLGLQAIYNFGDVNIPGLRAFKLDYYKSIIYYNKYSLEDYIKILEQE